MSPERTAVTLHDDDPLLEESSGGLDVATLALGLARSRYWIVALAFVGGAAGLVAAALQPNSYQSVGRLRLNAGKREALTPEVVAGLSEEDARAYPAMEDELLLLQDPAIFRSVAQRLGPSNVLEPSDPEQFDSEETAGHVRFLHRLQKKLIEASSGASPCADGEGEDCLQAAAQKLQGSTELWYERGSNVISMYYEASSPQRAKHYADELLAAFVERHREEYAARRFYEQHQDKLLEAYDAFEESEQAYSDHVKLCGFVDLETQKTTIVEEIEKLENELFLKMTTREQVRAQLTALETEFEHTPETVEKKTPPVMGLNPRQQLYQSHRMQLVLDKIRVKSDQSLALPQRQALEEALDQQIEAVDELLADTPLLVEQVPEISQMVSNPAHERLREEVGRLRAEDVGYGQGVQRLEEFLRKKRDDLDRARACDRPHAIHELNINERRRAYDTLSERAAELESLLALDLEGESNLSVFQPATLPVSKQGPQRAKIVGMGLFGGLAAGVALAVLRQLLDPRVRYPHALERQLRAPVLAVVPEARGLRKLSRTAG